MLVRCYCGWQKTVKDELHGRTGVCPKCGSTFTLVPADGEEIEPADAPCSADTQVAPEEFAAEWSQHYTAQLLESANSNRERPRTQDINTTGVILVGLAVMVGLILLSLSVFPRPSERPPATHSDQRLTESIEAALQWIDHGGPQSADTIERDLQNAISSSWDVPQRETGERVLQKLLDRRTSKQATIPDVVVSNAQKARTYDVLLGGEVSGEQWDRYFSKSLVFEQLVKPDKKSAFDSIPKWDSAFSVKHMPLAPGVSLSVDVENIGNEINQSRWGLLIYVVNASRRPPPLQCTLGVAADGDTDYFECELVGSPTSIAPLQGYSYDEDDRFTAIAPVVQKMISARKVEFRFSIDGKSVDGRFSDDALKALQQLVKVSLYEDRKTQLRRLGL